MLRYGRQILIFLVVVLAAGYWQSRHMRRGTAPETYVTKLEDSASLVLPIRANNIELFYFFAPWCQVCQYSVSNAETVARWFPELKLHFVALDYADAEEVKKFAGAYLKTAPVLGNELVRESWAVSAYPSMAIVNASGNISFVSVGYSTTLGIAARVMLARLGL
jgi:thiol-disulfide isomerase/thioredoxin